ncbi:unnamed protein product [Adineta ricciae]|uniref:Uncharacterized protein n=1 Tax=Adineta ricciae TaxID=249248 RepID=A0A814KP88_ADIRI|nr:unnamed protein product [Adineta ricciae]
MSLELNSTLYPGYYGTVGSGRKFKRRFQSFPTVSCKLRAGNGQELIGYFLCNSGWNPAVRNLPELAGIGENCVGIEKSCTGTDSDFNGSSLRNDRPGYMVFHRVPGVATAGIRNVLTSVKACLSLNRLVGAIGSKYFNRRSYLMPGMIDSLSPILTAGSTPQNGDIGCRCQT